MRIATVMAVTAAGALALTGCEKPAPGATVWSGTSSQFESALCWSFDEEVGIDERACAEALAARVTSASSLPTIEILGGNTIGISVDPVVADNGWIPTVGSQDLAEQPITTTYWRFTLPDLQTIPEGGFTLELRAYGSADNLRGLWAFNLVPR